MKLLLMLIQQKEVMARTGGLEIKKLNKQEVLDLKRKETLI